MGKHSKQDREDALEIIGAVERLEDDDDEQPATEDS